MNHHISKEVRFKSIYGEFFVPSRSSQVAVIYIRGSKGKSNINWFASICSKSNISCFIPDLIGTGQSSGNTFSFDTCIQTIYEAELFLSAAGFNRISLVGTSFGASFLPLYFKKYPASSITNVGLLMPVTEYGMSKSWHYPEESDKDFYAQLTADPYYRNIDLVEWQMITEGNPQTNPILNSECLSRRNVFIAHGNKDTVINWRRSYRFFQKLSKITPKCEYHLLKNALHSGKGRIRAFGLFVDFLQKHE